MRIKLTFVIIFFSLSAYGQQRPLEPVSPQVELLISGAYKNYRLYNLDRFDLFLGTQENNLKYKVIEPGTGTVLLDKDHSESDAMILKPRFFKDSLSNMILMFIETAAESSWGQEVFWIDETNIYELGYLNFSADNFNSTSIIDYCDLTINNTKVSMTFFDSVLIDWSDESKMSATELELELSIDGIRRIK